MRPIRTGPELVGRGKTTPKVNDCLPATMAKLVERGIFEPADDGSFILTAKGRRLAKAGKVPKL